MEVNLFSIVEAQSIFVPSLLQQNSPAAIVNLGSKEGITTPPGNAAYSVSKAGVKVLTEQLAHELRQIPDHQVTAHLLVPGYTWTPMNFPNADFSNAESKPAAPWSP
ncbi:SDR family NAD(P)-dependent oxidoreductase, partial [Streptococcus pyogenes]